MSTIKVDTIQNTSGVEVYTAKAWVNFNGTGTVAIRASGNVSSITDNATGTTTVNFGSAISDANFSTLAHAGTLASLVANSVTNTIAGTQTTTSSQVQTTSASHGSIDQTAVYVGITR